MSAMPKPPPDLLQDVPGEIEQVSADGAYDQRLQTRRIDNQFKELMLKIAILNRMTHLGMPDSVKVVG